MAEKEENGIPQQIDPELPLCGVGCRYSENSLYFTYPRFQPFDPILDGSSFLQMDLLAKNLSRRWSTNLIILIKDGDGIQSTAERREHHCGPRRDVEEKIAASTYVFFPVFLCSWWTLAEAQMPPEYLCSPPDF